MNNSLKSDRRRRSKRVMMKLQYSPPPKKDKKAQNKKQCQSNINTKEILQYTECRERSLSPDINVVRRQLKALADWV